MDASKKRRPPIRATYSRKETRPSYASLLSSPSSSPWPKRRKISDEILVRSSSVVATTEGEEEEEDNDGDEGSDKVVGDEEEATTTTPPSSPPRLLSPPHPPASKVQQRGDFSFFFTHKGSSTLSGTGARVSLTKNKRSRPLGGLRPSIAAAKKLTQMTLDLGQSLRTTCSQCGMSFHPSNPSDESLHKRFHSKSVGGVDFGTKPVSTKVLWEEEKMFVVCVDRRCSAAEKRKAKEVLEVVESELGAAEICADSLWGEGERFRIYLFVSGRKCVGLLLGERIKRGYKVVLEEKKKKKGNNEGEDDEDRGKGVIKHALEGSLVSFGPTKPHPAQLGISRIWTCASHRRQGIAKRLLDTARESFIYGMKIEKNMVAFSQPTDSGRRLAGKWFGGERWSVYVEE